MKQEAICAVEPKLLRALRVLRGKPPYPPQPGGDHKRYCATRKVYGAMRRFTLAGRALPSAPPASARLVPHLA